jgi:N-acetylglucosaminyldiphosphoundecaprenol N-acetyl-beta-D-mannosaminyltransferase
VLNTRISLVNLEQAAQSIESLIAFGGKHYICVCNVHTVMTGVDDEKFQQITNNAALAVPDGMPLVWAARLLGFDQRERVYGPDLFLTVCERSVSKGYSHFFYGGGPGVPERLEENLSSRFPGIRIAGCYSPPFRPLTEIEDDQVVKAINASGADILWVGLGAPKQEYWMASHVGRISTPVMVGVGAAFDFHAGQVKQAPRWMQDRGLEWVFRLCVEPRRLWKRYLYNNPRFVYHLGKQVVSDRLKLRRK